MSPSIGTTAAAYVAEARGRSLGHVASWNVLASLIQAAGQWALLVILAKLGTAEMVGQLALGLAMAAPVFLLASLSLREVLVTDARGEHAAGDYLALRLLGAGAGLLTVAALALAVGGEGGMVVVLVGVLKAIEAVSDVFHGIMQRQERTELIAASMGARGLLSVLVLAAGVQVWGRVSAALLLVAATWALVLVAFDRPRGARLLPGGVRPRWAGGALRRLTGIALPLGATAMLVSLSVTIPRYVVEWYHGTHELGVFVALASVVLVGATFVNAIGQSVSPRLARYYAAGDRLQVRRLLLILVGLGILCGGLGLLLARVWGRELLTLVYRPEYAEHAQVFEMLAVAGGIGYLTALLGHAVTSARLFRAQVPLYAAVSGTALVSGVALVPSRGLMGTAEAGVLTALVALLGTVTVNLYALRRLAPAEVSRWT